MNIILNDFNKLKEDGLITKDFSNMNELLDVLSEMFADEYYNVPDAQEAFDNLNDELNGLFNKHCAVYSLGTKEWDIVYPLNIKDEDAKSLVLSWNEYYSENLKNLSDVCSSISHRVMKDMSNCGCDVHNALAMICDDVFGGEHPFYIDLGEENPRISFL